MPAESPVLSFLETLGAHRAERYGAVTAAHYGDPLEEHKAVRREVGLIDTPQLGAVRIVGNDRVPFLHRMITSDVRSLSPGEGQLSSFLTTRGKFVALFRLLSFPESHLALINRDLADRLIQELDKFLIVEEVELVDEGAMWGALQVAGPKSRELLASISGTELTHIGEGEYHFLNLPGLAEPAIGVRHCPTGEEGYDLLLPRDQLKQAWKTLLGSAGPAAVPVGAEAFDTLRVEAGTALFGVDIGDDLGPLEAGLEECVSFTKGCYLGQETVAKMHYRGKPPRRLVGLAVAGEEVPEPDAPIYAGNHVTGRITSAVYAPSLARVIALGVVRSKHVEKETPLHLKKGGATIGVRIEEMPFR